MLSETRRACDAVVQVALDAPQLGGLHIQGTAPRAREFVDELTQLTLPRGVQPVAVHDDRVDRQRHAEPEHRPERPEGPAARQRLKSRCTRTRPAAPREE